MTPPAHWAHLPAFRDRWPALRDRLMAEARPWAPGPDRVFRALVLTPPAAVRVVILGQDPYHAAGRATGLAFGYPPGVPPRHSLANILRELHDDLGIVRADGDLAGWAAQGVLLLNTVLSVPVGPGMAGGHARLGWQALTSEILAEAARAPCAFLLWGAPAQRAAPALDPARHLVVTAPHPSPLSARRGFFGHRPFSRVNAWLAGRGEAPIDWAA
ncbi:MAG: uracil-DNA glycosylase [Gemmobacter sp.]